MLNWASRRSLKLLLAQTTAETGYYDHRHARLNSLHCRGQLVAIFARHGEVGDDKSDSDWRSGLIRPRHPRRSENCSSSRGMATWPPPSRLS